MSAADEVEPRSQGPARGYIWPPFEPGNTAALKHGARSVTALQPIADEIRAVITEAAPWAASPAFAGTVESYAWGEAQARLYRADLEANGHHTDEGEERAAVRGLDRVEGRLAKLRDQLGLNPQALAKLLASAAQVAAVTGVDGSFAALQDEGRRILAARGIATTGAESPPTEPGDPA